MVHEMISKEKLLKVRQKRNWTFAWMSRKGTLSGMKYVQQEWSGFRCENHGNKGIVR